MSTPDGNMKPWREMTPAERIADRLRHFPTFVGRCGGRARFWSYSVTHSSSAIRIERPGVRGVATVSVIENAEPAYVGVAGAGRRRRARLMPGSRAR